MGFINNTFTKLQSKAEENNTFTKLQTKAEENNTFIKLQTKAEETFDKVKSTKTVGKKPTDSTTTPTTSWETSVANIDVIVTEVEKCSAGGTMDIVTVDGKGGKPTLGATMEEVLTDAFKKDLKEKSVSVLVLTTGRKPDDASLLEKSLSDAAKKVAKSGVKESPLSVTFIQIDKDQRAGAYLKQLERKMACERIQIVDTMTDVEIISTMKSINKSTKSSSKTGLIAGGLAGAAISAGGMYAYNKHQEAKKSSRKDDFNGQFKCFYEDEEITTLKVIDDQEGNLVIEGFHEEITVSGKYSGFHEIKKKKLANKKGQTSCREDIDIEVDEKIHVHEVLKKSSGEEIDIDIDVKIDMKEKAISTKQKAQRLGEADVETEVFIRFTNPSGELIEGTYMEEERIINWSDGSRWEAAYVSSEEVRVKNTKLVAGAAVVGAIAAGTTGYVMDKKFFNKVSKKDQCDYIIIVDRSANKMAPHSTCATTEEIDIDIEIHEKIHVHEDVIKKKESANKKGGTSRKEDIDIEVNEKIHVHEDFKKSSGSKTKRTNEEVDIEIDVKIDMKEKVTTTKQKAQIPAYLRK